MPVMEPDDVVAEALAALGTAPLLVPGEMNRQASQAIAALPRAQAIDLMSQVTSRLLPRA
jgi:hypothetical protein